MNSFYGNEGEIFYRVLAEKQEIRRSGNKTGIIFCLLSVIMIFLISLIAVLLPHTAQQAYADAAADPVLFNLFQILVSTVGFIIPFVLFCKMMNTRVSNVLMFRAPRKKGLFVPFVLCGFAFCGVANLVTAICGDFFVDIGFSYPTYDTPDAATGFFGVALSVLATAIAPALVEEFALRGVTLGVLRKYGDGFAILVSSLLFGLMHGNISQIPFAFLLGLYFGYITVKTESVLPAMVVHFGNNLMSVLSEYVYPKLSGAALVYASLGYNLLMLAVGFFGVYLLRNKGKELLKLNPADCILPLPKRMVTFFTAPVMWVFYLLVLYKMW